MNIKGLTWAVAIIALVNSIHSAVSDEASDAVQVLSKLWTAMLNTDYQPVTDEKTFQYRHTFVGDSKTYKMHLVFRNKEEGIVRSALTRRLSGSWKRTEIPCFALCIHPRPYWA